MTRYASHQFYNQQMAKALAAPEIKRRRYATPRAPIRTETDAGAVSSVVEELLAALQTKRAQVRDEQDTANAFRMLKDRNAPQKEWDVEEYGSTPETLRAATMPGALTDGAPPTSATASVLRARPGGARAALIPVDVFLFLALLKPSPFVDYKIDVMRIWSWRPPISQLQSK